MNPAPNIVLVGPMGAGKTSIGQRLAPRLGLQFVDSDRWLEREAGKSVARIFAEEGEEGFRHYESLALAELLQGNEQLIATGGGAVLLADNRQRMHARSFVVYLKTSIERQLERLERDQLRPLLSGGNRSETLRMLAVTRNPLYEEVADLSFDTGERLLSVATEHLFGHIKAAWHPIDTSP